MNSLGFLSLGPTSYCEQNSKRRRRATICRSSGDRVDMSPSSSGGGEGGRGCFDWREFRAKMVLSETSRTITTENGKPQWCHRIPRAEKGGILLANPEYFRENQQHFQHAVIFLLGHDETGSYGLMLNKRLRESIGDVSRIPKTRTTAEETLSLKHGKKTVLPTETFRARTQKATTLGDTPHPHFFSGPSLYPIFIIENDSCGRLPAPCRRTVCTSAEMSARERISSFINTAT